MNAEEYAALAWDYKQEAQELEHAAYLNMEEALSMLEADELDEAVRLLYRAIDNIQGAQIDRAAQKHNEQMAESAA